MADDFDEDIFDDLYDDEPQAAPAAPAPPAVKSEPEPAPAIVNSEESLPVQETTETATAKDELIKDVDANMSGSTWVGNDNNSYQPQENTQGGGDDAYGPINVKEDGYV